MDYKSTRDVAKILGINPSRLARAIWDGRLDAPERSPGGAFLWTEHDTRRASWVLLGRDFDGFDHGHGGGPVGTKRSV